MMKRTQIEPSIKQREMLNAYKADRHESSWPILKRLLRPEPLVIPMGRNGNVEVVTPFISAPPNSPNKP